MVEQDVEYYKQTVLVGFMVIGMENEELYIIKMVGNQMGILLI